MMHNEASPEIAPEPKEPHELVVRGDNVTVGYACAGCLFYFTDYAIAKSHCDRRCTACSSRPRYIGVKCRECLNAELDVREVNRFNAAIKLTADQYEGPVYCPHTDEYSESWEEVVEEAEYKEALRPLYVYACTVFTGISIDVDDVLENACQDMGREDDHFSDFLADVDELRDFIKQWSAKQTVRHYEPDYSRVILIPAKCPDAH